MHKSQTELNLFLTYRITRRVPVRHTHRGDNWEGQGGLNLPVRGTVALPILILLSLTLSGTAPTLHSTTEGLGAMSELHTKASGTREDESDDQGQSE